VDVSSPGAAPARHPLRAVAVAVGVVVLVAGLAAVALYLWLGAYAPLDARGSFAPGPGTSAPIAGAAGKPAFAPAGKGRMFDTAFTVRNTGRFTVTVRSLEPLAGDGPQPVRLLATDSATASADPGHLHRFGDVRLGPGDSAIIVVRWSLGCGSADAVRLRYEYLSLFDRAQTLTLPFAVTPRC
jgi:hypothetical protein